MFYSLIYLYYDYEYLYLHKVLSIQYYFLFKCVKEKINIISKNK